MLPPSDSVQMLLLAWAGYIFIAVFFSRRKNKSIPTFPYNIGYDLQEKVYYPEKSLTALTSLSTSADLKVHKPQNQDRGSRSFF